MADKRKVLIIDDDKFLLNMYAVKFEKAGYEVKVADGSQKALDMLRDEYKADILMVDIVMPGMDGLELVDRIKKERLVPGAIIIMLTNQGGSTEIEKAKSLGVHGYIVKATSIPSEVVEEVINITKANSK